ANLVDQAETAVVDAQSGRDIAIQLGVPARFAAHSVDFGYHVFRLRVAEGCAGVGLQTVEQVLRRAQLRCRDLQPTCQCIGIAGQLVEVIAFNQLQCQSAAGMLRFQLPQLD